MAAFLTPGILTKLLDNIGSDAKVAGAHRAAFLQVVGIVPAISASDHLCPRHGFYIKVSDSSHCTYMCLAEEHDDLILSNKLQLGQLIQVERLDLGSPVPILRGVQPLPGKHSFFGNPEELHVSDFSDFLHEFSAAKPSGEGKESSKANNLAATGLLGLPSEPGCDRRCSLGSKDARVKIDKPAEKNECLKGPEFSSPPVFTSPRNKLLPGRRSGERASWAIVGAPLAEILEESQQVRPSRTKVIPEFSPVHSRSVSASPARHHSVRSSLVFEKDGLDMSRAAAKGSPEVRKSFQKMAVSSTMEASSRFRQVSPAVKRAVSVGKVGQRLSAEETKTNSNPLRKSISKGRMGDTLSTKMSSDNKIAQRCREDTGLPKFSRCEINNVMAERETAPLKSMTDVKAGPGASVVVSSKVDDYFSLPSSPSLVAVSDARSVKLEKEAQVPSDLLSANLLALGKKAVQRQQTATTAASEALQEASATQAIVQCLSDFAEFCTAARPENPGPVVDKFFAFYNVLVDAGKNACAMAESRLLIGSERKNKEAILVKRSCRVSNEKRQAAASWVNAALSSGLTACPWASRDQKPLKSPTREGFDGKCCKNKMSSFSSPARVLARPPACHVALSNSINGTQNRSFMSPPPFRALVDEHGWKGSKTPSSECQSETFQPVDMKEPPPSNVQASKDILQYPPERRADVLLEWAKGNGFAETVVLAKELQTEAEAWFLRFVESALDSGYKAAIRVATVRNRTKNASSPWPDDNNQVSAVLSDLKRVNEWLDEMTCGRRTFPSSELEDTTAKLKQKLYDLLIQLVLRSPSQIISHSLGS